MSSRLPLLAFYRLIGLEHGKCTLNNEDTDALKNKNIRVRMNKRVNKILVQHRNSRLPLLAYFHLIASEHDELKFEHCQSDVTRKRDDQFLF